MARVGYKKIEKREREEKDKAEVNAEATKLDISKEPMAVEETQESMQGLCVGVLDGGEGVFMKGIGQCRRLNHRIGRLGRKLRLPQMRSLVRGGLGGGCCRGRRDSRSDRVIFIDDNMQTIVLIIVRDRRRGRRRRRRCQNGTKISCNLRIKRNLGIMLFMVKSRRKKRRGRIEIGRDAAAFFSDLNFRFLLMHYIIIYEHQIQIQQNYRNPNPQNKIYYL